MTAIGFLKKELRALVSRFPQLQLRYGYNDMVGIHVVEILPLAEYANNKALSEAWIDLAVRFMERFEEEEISFISSDSSLSAGALILELNAKSVLQRPHKNAGHLRGPL